LVVKRIYAGAFALVGWSAVVGQYFASHAGSLSSTIDYFSYFSVLSNILVAATLTSAAVAPQSAVGSWLLRPGVAVATAVYISVTGLTYYLILSDLYDLKGWVLLFDRLLHYVMPPAYVLFWLMFMPRGQLRLSAAAWALIPPIGYAAYTFVHGPWTGFYPYPFVDIPKIGVWNTARNVLQFVVFFYVMGAIYVVLDRLISRWSGRSMESA
jgi:hypothetical protein